jgi:hypothetical protein
MFRTGMPKWPLKVLGFEGPDAFFGELGLDPDPESAKVWIRILDTA